MSSQIKGFITCDRYVDNSPNIVSPLYEISGSALTYSKNRQQYFSTEAPEYSLYIFDAELDTTLSQSTINLVIKVVIKLTELLKSTPLTNKQQIIQSYLSFFNSENPVTPVSNVAYNNTVDYEDIRGVDYVSFMIQDVICNIWCSDGIFRTFYPKYEVNVVLPFENFTSIVNNTSAFIDALASFDLLSLNDRIEVNKNNLPTTYTKILNIPYKIPNTEMFRDCFFAFNIYGLQGNYSYILKLELYNYLTQTLGLVASDIEALFPSILNINEFFIIPRWDKVSIPTRIGQAAINSQISHTYNEEFDINKFIPVYTDINYLKNNTLSVPYDYNNLLLNIVNGYYTEEAIHDFDTYYNDIITVTSTHPDFARMSTRTQNFMTLLENLIDVSNCSDSTQLFNKLINNTNFKFTIINRAGVDYISIFFNDHQYYVIPKYTMLSLLGE